MNRSLRQGKGAEFWKLGSGVPGFLVYLHPNSSIVDVAYTKNVRGGSGGTSKQSLHS
jgi:hypothetical protein